MNITDRLTNNKPAEAVESSKNKKATLDKPRRKQNHRVEISKEVMGRQIKQDKNIDWDASDREQYVDKSPIYGGANLDKSYLAR